MTCSLLSKVFKNQVQAASLGARLIRRRILGLTKLLFLGPSPSSAMVEEDQAGISCYANSAPGFRGILKQRYADFIVNEVDCEGQGVHLTCLEVPEEVLEGQNKDLQDEDDLAANVEKYLEAFKAISADGDIDLLKGLLLSYMEGKKGDCEPIVLAPDADKSHRTEVHNFFKSRLPFFVTDTVDGPDSTSKCVRVRILDVKCGSTRKRMRRMGGSRCKNKLQRHEGSFDSRGAENWPLQRGKYLQFHLYKENKDTYDALMVLGKKLRIQPKSFGFAGTKDKRAVTTQRVTAFKLQASKLAALNSKLYGIKVGDFSYIDRALVLGQLSGNQFTITLRAVSAESEVIEEAAISLAKSGFINYFGLQRFGTGPVPTFTVGAALLRGEWEAAVNLILQPRDGEQKDIAESRDYFMRTKDADGTLLRMPRQFVIERAVLAGLRKSPGNYLQAIHNIPRTMRMMYVHSYQSYLWNHAASKRISLYGVDKVIEGDLILCKESDDSSTPLEVEAAQEDEEALGAELADNNDSENQEALDAAFKNVKHATAEDVVSEKFTIKDVVLPIPGSKTLLPANEIADVYKELARKDSLDLQNSAHNVKDFSFLHLPGNYRLLVQEAKDFDWKVLKYNDQTRALAETDWDRINKRRHEADGKVGEMQETMPGASQMPCNMDGEQPSQQTAVQIQFTLPSSCYATMALRELMKMSSSVACHKILSEEEGL